MNNGFPGVSRLLALVATVLAILVVFTIAFVDGPAPSQEFRSVVAVHDSLIPTHTVADERRDSPPLLLAEVQVRHDDVVMSSQGIRWRGYWFSVHAIDGQPGVPPQARLVRNGEPEMYAFDVGDLTLVTWLHHQHTVAVASSASEPTLLELALIVEPTGRYVPAVTAPGERPDPAAPPDGGPGRVPAPR